MTLVSINLNAHKETQQDQAADWGPLSELPGNPMIWILILGEMAVFGALLLGFSVARVLDLATFAASQLHLHRLLGGVNTLVLVSSGFLVAAAVWHRQHRRDGRLLMIGGMVLGVAFLAIKGVEYSELFASGFDIETNTFFQLYFLITGFHAVHIVLGLAILGITLFADSVENLETGAAFWHMLDMVWVIIYPIIYLVR